MAPDHSVRNGALAWEIEDDDDRDGLTPTDRVVWEATRRLSSTLTFDDDGEEEAREAEVCHLRFYYLTPRFLRSRTTSIR